MKRPSTHIALESPFFPTELSARSELSCTVRLTGAQGQPSAVGGTISQGPGGWAHLHLTLPMGDSSVSRVLVEVPSRCATFETAVVRRLSDSDWVLATPFWMEGTERRRAERMPVQLPVRCVREGETAWYSGTFVNMSRNSVALEGPVRRKAGEIIVIRFYVPGYPLPLLLRAHIKWVSARKNSFLAGAEFRDLPLQTETILERFVDCRPYPAREGGTDRVLAAN